MNKNISKKLAKCKKKISKKLNKRNWDEQSIPMFKASNIQYEIDGRLLIIPSLFLPLRAIFDSVWLPMKV